MLDGVKVNCLLDSGAEVSTLTEDFFQQHFRPSGYYPMMVEDNCR